MSPSKHEQALNDYVGLMQEAKDRLLAMDTALDGQTGLPPGAIKEYCFLQLRMLCELIALGCLTAHGDLATGKLKKKWESDKIISGLEPLHSNFYPHAAIRTDKGPKLHDGGLTKKELPKLYRRCGDVLHRGSFKAHSFKRYSDADIEEIRAWKTKIEAFSCHGIYTVGEKSMMLFYIREDGRAWWETWEPRWPDDKQGEKN